MSYLGPLYEGDFNIGPSTDISQFGYGDLTVYRNVIINGTINSTGSNSIGSLLVNGGVLIQRDVHINGKLYVLYDSTNLTETHIDTNNGATTITGGNGLEVSVGGSSYIISTGGNTTLQSTTQQLQLYGGLPGSTAIDINSTDNLGGIRLLSGTSGLVNIIGGSGGISGVTSSGNLTLTANNAPGSFTVNSSSGNQDLSFTLTGATDSGIKIQSSGINYTNTAIKINTTNTNGNIVISNVDGLGEGNTSILTGASGYIVLTNTGGSISQTSQGAESSYIVNSNNSNQNLNLSLNGTSDSSININSSGTNTTNNAININTTNTNGSIVIRQTSGSIAGTYIYTGSGGFLTSTQTGGTINMTSYGANSYYTNETTSDNQNLYISVNGNTDSKVVISSTGKSSDAITLQTTNGTGGIYINSVGPIGVQTTNTVNGIRIGTSTSVPITIGTNTSTTTILGDLYVRGNSSSVDLQVVTVDDNIMTVNNAPYGTSDGGYAIKRYQPANDSGLGDVVLDTADLTGTIQNTGNSVTTTTIDPGASNIDNYYNGWWIKILTGTGAGQVRKVKSYDGTSKLITIYDTFDQTNTLNNTQPTEGLDFITILDNSSTYGLYPCHYVMNIWDESADEFAFVCSASNPSDPNNPVFEPTISHYSNLHINNLQSNAIYTNTINDSTADITTNITLTDNTNTPVSITALPNDYGMYMILVKPLTNNLRTLATFIIGRLDAAVNGQNNRIFSIKGTQNEQLGIQWNASQYPELFYKINPGVAGTTTYKLKIITI